ncbi:MAG: aldolase/citrate lyase family protein [Bryobacteraceae bacterium]
MILRRVVLCAAVSAMLCLTTAWVAQAQQGSMRMYNTAKQKLKEGKKIVGGTVSTSDPDIYCAMANAGFDFTWIEMQHSPLTHHEVARMIWACRGASAIPFIRVADATEGEIQKATDNGALGIIVPMVDTVEKAEAAVKFAKYPPVGRRSQGGGQYRALWGADYRQTFNDNLIVVAMIENPAGVDIADKIAAVPGVDVVFIASTDLGSFSGLQQGNPKYEALVTRAREAILKAGKTVGGPHAWKDREGYHFFQGAGETSLIRSGAQAALGAAPAPSGRRSGARPGVAPTEGEEPK